MGCCSRISVAAPAGPVLHLLPWWAVNSLKAVAGSGTEPGVQSGGSANDLLGEGVSVRLGLELHLWLNPLGLCHAWTVLDVMAPLTRSSTVTPSQMCERLDGKGNYMYVSCTYVHICEYLHVCAFYFFKQTEF